MIKKSIMRAVVFLLCISFLFGLVGCGLFPGRFRPKTSGTRPEPEPYTKRHYFENIQHFDIPFEDRSRDAFDKEAFIKAYFEFEGIIEDEYAEENEARLLELYEEMKSGLTELKTDVAIATYYYNLDVTNQENAEYYTAKSELYSSYFAKSLHQFRSVFSTEYETAFRAHIGDQLANSFSGTDLVTEEEKVLKSRMRELKQKYDTLIAQDADDMTLKQLYIEIVNTNNDYARLRGFDSYVDYAYAEEFIRDYTIEDIKAIEGEIVSDFLPLYEEYVIYVTDDGTVYDVEEENYDSGEEKFTRLRKCIKNISPELVESLDHLIKNGLYDVDDLETKLRMTGFSQRMYSYNDAYIFITPNHKVADYITVLHEFGHYNRYYYTVGDPFSLKSPVDVEEIMSQGIQLLCYDYYGDYHEKYGDALAIQTVFQKMSAVLEGFAVNEAERCSYETPDLTAEKLDTIWKEAYKKFGISQDGTSWTQISQVYQKPFYYIGYATSGLASFEILAESRKDINVGIEKYMTLTALPQGVKFTEALYAAGLNNIFEQGTVTALSKELADALEIQR